MIKKSKITLIILLFVFLAIPNTSAQDKKAAPQGPRPIELKDILAWKSIGSSVLSNNGQWFAYSLSPNKGDSDIIIKQTKGDKEYTFPIGQASRGAGAIAFSDDSRWLGFTIYPTEKEAKTLRKQKKKLYNKVALLNLSSGKKVEFEKTRRFTFSGEQAKWIVLHKYPPESLAQEKNKWKGTDLILHELASSKELNIGNVSEYAFDKKGLWLAMVVDAKEMSGNGIQLRNMQTGVVLSLENDKAVYQRLNWTEEGEALAVLKGKEDENYEDKLYSVVGFTNFIKGSPQKTVYETATDKGFPKDMTISPNRTPVWTEDLSGILFGIHDVKKKEEKDKEKVEKKEDKPEETPEKKKAKAQPKDKPRPKEEEEEEPADLVIWHWLDKRLQSMQQVQENRDKNFNFLSIYRVKEKKFIRLADEDVRQVSANPRHHWAIGTDNQEYELIGNLEGRRYQDVYVIDLKTGVRKLVLKKWRWSFGLSTKGTHFLFYDDGHFYTYEMATGKKFNITKDVPTSFINEEDDHNVIKPPIYPRIGWTNDDASILLYDNWDIWKIPVHGGKGVNLTVNGKKDGIRYRSRYRLDPEEQGIDLSKPLYISAYGEWTKKGGVARVDKGKPGATMLLWDDASFSIRKAEKADVYLYTRQTYKDYPDYYVTDSSLKKGSRLTEATPQQKEFLWSSGSILLDYESDKGDKLQAALFLPANYEKGKSYPTVVYIYEKVSQGLNRYYTPSARGFNKSVYTSNGYAVLMPDIVYKVNDPGMSSVWCVLPAINAAIKTGVVDKNNIGIHGHSWGGYQSSFLVTQTDIFKACVTGAPLTNMISMYSSIYWNSGSANQPIFESSQGRFEGGYWENIEAYTRNSPVYFAENVKTPLIILHNDNDGAVDWNQGIEYFNTLRRLGKSVVMLQYKGENHGLRKPENQRDYTIRMRQFFDHHLKGKPAPDWLKEGVPHLKLKDHLKEMSKKK